LIDKNESGKKKFFKLNNKNKMNSSTTNGVADDPPGSENSGGGRKNGIDRLRALEALFLEGPVNAHEAKCFSTETLLDVLVSIQ
jgi:hypothetical protein